MVGNPSVDGGLNVGMAWPRICDQSRVRLGEAQHGGCCPVAVDGRNAAFLSYLSAKIASQAQGRAPLVEKPLLAIVEDIKITDSAPIVRTVEGEPDAGLMLDELATLATSEFWTVVRLTPARAGPASTIFPN
jgi:hypothetical protein